MPSIGRSGLRNTKHRDSLMTAPLARSSSDHLHRVPKVGCCKEVDNVEREQRDTPAIIESDNTIDTLLHEWQSALGSDYTAYRNHVYRVFNFSSRLADATGDDKEKLAIAAAFHDVGIWLDGTFDYLEPSSRRALDYLSRIGRTDWSETVHQMIDQHHKIRSWRGSRGYLVESFRRADWLDVCLFALPSSLERAYLAEVLRRFPRAGFHRRLVSLTLGWARKHPFNPLPIFKW
jgi:hypothetical protein